MSAVALSLLLGAAAPASDAVADVDRLRGVVRLDWDAQGRCASADEVMRRIAALSTVETAQIDPIAVRARVTGGGSRWTLELEVRTTSGTNVRSTVESRCERLVEFTAVVTAIALDDSAPSHETPPVIEPPPPVRDVAPPLPSAVAAPPAKVVAPTRHVQRRRELQGHAGASFGVDAAALPVATPTIEISTGLRARALQIELFGAHAFRRELRPHDIAPAGGSFSAWMGGARLCAVVPVAPLLATACAGASLGGIRARGLDVARPRVDRQLWAAATLGAGVKWILGRRVALTGHAELVVPVVRPAFRVEDRLVYRVRPIGGRALFGIAVVFP